MAERQPEEEEGKFQCELCPNAYKSAKSLKRHLGEKHADDPLLQEAKESVRKDTCPFCMEAFGNVMKHKRSCKRNPDVALPPQVPPARVQPPQEVQPPPPPPPPPRVLPMQQRPPHPYEKLSNAEMVEKFADRLVHRLKLDAKGTVPDYVRVLKQFIQHETNKDTNFRAFQWFVVGTQQEIDPRFKPISELQDYIQALVSDQGEKTAERMTTVYSHLLKWIEEQINEQRSDPVSLVRQRGANAKEARAVAHRSGAFKPGQGRKVKLDTVTQHLDVEIVREVLRVFLGSPLLHQTMETFSTGTYVHEGCTDTKCKDSRCMLGIKDMQDAQNFLALAIFLSNFGLRLEVAMNVTFGALRGAAHALDVCPYCNGKHMYAEHKKLCHR